MSCTIYLLFSAKGKERLSWLLFCHLFLGISILLNNLGIIPESYNFLGPEIPDNFQWIWIAGSFICYLFGKVTMKSSKTWSIQVFAVLVLIFGVLPITYHQVLLVFSNISKLGLVGSLLSMFKDLSLGKSPISFMFIHM